MTYNIDMNIEILSCFCGFIGEAIFLIGTGICMVSSYFGTWFYNKSCNRHSKPKCGCK